MVQGRYSFTAELWEHDGPAAWYFLDVPETDADEIEELFGASAKGFGSIRVEVTIGSSRWSTSLFPDNKRRTSVLPVKKQVRVTENLVAGSTAEVELVVLE